VSDETPSTEPASAPAPETPAPAPEAPPAETPAPAPAAEAPAPEAAPAAEAPPAEAPAPEVPTAATAPTQTEIPAAAAPAAPAAVPVEPVAPAKSSSHVAVPKWVLATVGAVLGAAVMFGIGYAVGDSAASDGDDAAVSTPFNPGDDGPGQPVPRFPGGNQESPGSPGGNQGGNGNQGGPNQGGGNQGGGSNQGGSQTPPTSGAFLGVATQQTAAGLEVVEVVPNSAADDAGLEVGDVIVEFDGNEVTTPAQLANYVRNLDPGDEVKITYVRDGDTETTTAELGSRSATNRN